MNNSDLHTLGREALLARLTERLQGLDDAGLVALELQTRPASALPGDAAVDAAADTDATAEGEPAQVSRRSFLRQAVGFGALGVAVTAGAGYAAWELGGRRARSLAELTLGAEVLKLRGLLALYEAMEGIGIDEIVGSGLSATQSGLALVEAGAGLLKTGLERIEAALLRVDDAFPSLNEGMAWVEDLVADTAAALQRLEDALGRVFGVVRPVAQAVTDFVDSLLQLLPFGAGESIRQGLRAMRGVLTSLPELLLGLNERLLTPLRTRWFAPDPETGLVTGLVSLLATQLLDPLEKHLGEIIHLSQTWQERLALPVAAATAERGRLRSDIQQLRAENGY